ncbi:uncharacterized protein LOC127288668 [Leptopilina boulardi]|uniref:uncharacterized protein LOC127288668 n=1 Tax=Leptopilina boulardi TaxID=63433 RepID=UPI0021F6898B|nr:uncharacterized protein LOC127288668 [Leptopilina boulardi]
MVQWLYCMILLPRFLHASVVWWIRSQLKTVKLKLGQLQAMVFRGVTGGMRTMPSSALGFFLAEKPLHILTVNKAALTMIRLQAQGKWKAREKHTKFPASILNIPEINMGQDRMVKRVKFKPRFKTIIPSRKDWEKGCPLGCELWFTDGSKMERGTDLGVYCKSNATKVTLSLGHYTTVWQAEVCAVMTCAMICLEKGKSSKRINICVDSQAALNALRNPTIESKLVLECRKVLDEIGLKNKLSLIWVPGHSGIRGNEEADTLARRGSEMTMIGPEPAVVIMPSAVKGAIERWSRRCHERVGGDYCTTSGKPCPCCKAGSQMGTFVSERERVRADVTMLCKWVTSARYVHVHVQTCPL